MYKNKDDLKNNNFKLPIEPYLQRTHYTCVAASYLMCLHYLRPEDFKLTEDTELDLHNKIKFWDGGDGEYGSYPKLAKHAISEGLKVQMTLHGLKKPSHISKDTWDHYMENFLPIIEELRDLQNFSFNEEDFNVIDIINNVSQGMPSIVEIKYPTDEVTHHIVVRGFKNGIIQVLDPIRGFNKYYIDVLDEQINIGYMKNYISLSNG